MIYFSYLFADIDMPKSLQSYFNWTIPAIQLEKYI